METSSACGLQLYSRPRDWPTDLALHRMVHADAAAAAAAAVLQTWMHGCERWTLAVVLLCTDLLGGTLAWLGTTGVFCTLARF